MREYQRKQFPGCHCQDHENSSSVGRCLDRYTDSIGSDDDDWADSQEKIPPSEFEAFFHSQQGPVESRRTLHLMTRGGVGFTLVGLIELYFDRLVFQRLIVGTSVVGCGDVRLVSVGIL
jgi:hypothetical protein